MCDIVKVMFNKYTFDMEILMKFEQRYNIIFKFYLFLATHTHTHRGIVGQSICCGV